MPDLIPAHVNATLAVALHQHALYLLGKAGLRRDALYTQHGAAWRLIAETRHRIREYNDATDVVAVTEAVLGLISAIPDAVRVLTTLIPVRVLDLDHAALVLNYYPRRRALTHEAGQWLRQVYPLRPDDMIGGEFAEGVVYLSKVIGLCPLAGVWDSPWQSGFAPSADISAFYPPPVIVAAGGQAFNG